MIPLRLALPAICAALLSPAAVERAAAEAPLAADRAAIEGCLGSSGIAARGCIGTVAVVCSRQAMNDGIRDDVSCARRETVVWRERLAASRAALSGQIDAEAGARLTHLQALAEDYITRKCAFLGEMAPAPRATRLEADCTLRETALRALELDRLIRRRGLADAVPDWGQEPER